MLQLDQLVPPVADIARAAGEVILEIYQAAAPDPEGGLLAYKADDSPLTRADVAAHALIAARLGALDTVWPVVSEEDAASLAHRRSPGTFWLVDPLDGTKEFLARNGEFTVNIALVSDGVAVLGVVYAPVLDQLYWGGRGVAACRADNGRVLPIRVAEPVPDGATWRVVASKSHLNAETSAFIAKLGTHALVQAGSSLKLCRVAEGTADVYPRLAPTCEWDTAAAQAVLEAAGGVVCDVGGAALRYGKTELLNPHFIAASSLAGLPIPA